MLKTTFKPKHEDNLMKNEGDVVAAREKFLLNPTNNLKFLLEKRFSWMNRFIADKGPGIEVGCGTGLSKHFIKHPSYQITDFAAHSWIDIKNVDALNTPFADQSFDFIISSNMIHHVPYPQKFFSEMLRLLRPGGLLLIQEINASFFMRLALRMMKHEGYSFEPNVFDRNQICTDPKDLWSANCAIPNLLFDDEEQFHRNVPGFKIIHQSYSEFFTFLNSGGGHRKNHFHPLADIFA